jgi:hypothetical protein
LISILIAKDIINMKKTVTMEWTKATKGTHVYSCSDTDTPVASIYIKRNALPDKAPNNITLTIEYDETA